MEPGTSFSAVLDDPAIADDNKETVERVVCLTGKIYYDLIKERQKRFETHPLTANIAFIRIEELCPFPFQSLSRTLKKYTNAKEFIWLQEEPRNQGAYMHVQGRINEVLKNIGYSGEVIYKGRDVNAVPAPGVARKYAAQQKKVLDAAFEVL